MDNKCTSAHLRQPTCLPGKETYVREMADLPFPMANQGETLSQAEQVACIQDMVGRIVTGFGPRRIVLFGSRARGDYRPDSDVNLFVVVDGEPNAFEASVDIRGVLFQSPLAKDIFVIPSSRWSGQANTTNDIVNCAMADGTKTLYLGIIYLTPKISTV